MLTDDEYVLELKSPRSNCNWANFKIYGQKMMIEDPKSKKDV